MKNIAQLITGVVDTIGKAYLRWTNPKRRIASLERKLEANREAQKKILLQFSTPTTRARFSKLIAHAVRLRKEIDRLQD